MVLSFAARLGFFVMAMALVGCDHATKLWATTTLDGSPHIEVVPGVLDLRYAENTDVAFHLMRVIPSGVRFPLIVALGTLGVFGMAYFWLREATDHRAEQAAYALLLGGAVGNLADRLVRGFVVDFIHLHHWPIFNVADLCLVAGGLMLVLHHLRRRRTEPPRPAPS